MGKKAETTSDVVSRIVYKGLGRRAEEKGIESLTADERVVLLVWWAKGIIDNGGFQYFYEGASNAADVADAFDVLGFPTAAEACRKSAAVFPESVLYADHETRREWMDSNYENIRGLFDALSEVIWNLGDDFEETVAAYIRAHPTTIQSET